MASRPRRNVAACGVVWLVAPTLHQPNSKHNTLFLAVLTHCRHTLSRSGVLPRKPVHDSCFVPPHPIIRFLFTVASSGPSHASAFDALSR